MFSLYECVYMYVQSAYMFYMYVFSMSALYLHVHCSCLFSYVLGMYAHRCMRETETQNMCVLCERLQNITESTQEPEGQLWVCILAGLFTGSMTLCKP